MQEDNVEITDTEAYHREFLGNKGSHVAVDLTIEDVSAEVKTKILARLDALTLVIHDILSEG